MLQMHISEKMFPKVQTSLKGTWCCQILHIKEGATVMKEQVIILQLYLAEVCPCKGDIFKGMMILHEQYASRSMMVFCEQYVLARVTYLSVTVFQEECPCKGDLFKECDGFSGALFPIVSDTFLKECSDPSEALWCHVFLNTGSVLSVVHEIPLTGPSSWSMTVLAHDILVYTLPSWQYIP